MPSTPTATDEKLEGRIDGLTATLADFRLETEKRFGSIETTLGDIRSDLKWIKVIGGFILALLIASGSGAARVIGDAATITSDIRQQGQRLDKVEKRLDGIDRKLDTLISRTAPAPKPGG